VTGPGAELRGTADAATVPLLVVTAGLPAAGKSTIAEVVGNRLGLPILSVDPIEAAILSAGIDSAQPTGLAAYLVAETMAEQVGIEYGRAMAASLEPSGEGQRSFRSALHAVADALTAHGFAAHTEASGDDLSIVSDTCPFAGSVASPVICAVDRGMVKGMLAALYGETTPETASSRAHGDATCITAVPVSL